MKLVNVADPFGQVFPAAFRRLCVETIIVFRAWSVSASSRLQAAVC